MRHIRRIGCRRSVATGWTKRRNMIKASWPGEGKPLPGVATEHVLGLFDKSLVELTGGAVTIRDFVHPRDNTGYTRCKIEAPRGIVRAAWYNVIIIGVSVKDVVAKITDAFTESIPHRSVDSVCNYRLRAVVLRPNVKSLADVSGF